MGEYRGVGKYVLIITAVLVVLWGVFAIFAPTGFLGLTDFQIGEIAGRATGFTLVIGIVVWLILKIFTKPKKDSNSN